MRRMKQKVKKRDVIELWTYGTYDEENDTDFGMSFEVPKRWFKSKLSIIGYKTIEEFLGDYTWDTTISIINMANNDGVLLSKKNAADSGMKFRR
jgi:hypothetical protein